ncbi:MAG: FAD-dependent oxidoreductase [Xanthobacteraceae bacterium]
MMMATRRQIIGAGAAAAGLLWMPAILTRSIAQTAEDSVAPLRGGEILPTPEFAQLRKNARFVAGVRPHRTGGVCLSRSEINTAKGTKFLIHNYGHSAAGITLSWGCASVVRGHVETVVNQMRGPRTRPSVAVLGSGVIGLTVAVELRRKWPTLPITIYAKTLDVAKTTSFIAAGQFAPSQICDEYEESDLPILEDYLRRSATRIREIENSGRRREYGVAQRKNYSLDGPNPSFDECTPGDVVPAFKRGKLPFRRPNEVGREYSTWLINPSILLPKLVADLKKGGVRFRTREFKDRQQVEDLKENIIVNCTGYGAKKLFDDQALEARRGHLVILRNPTRLKYFFSGGCENGAISYLFARQNDIVVGGTVIRDDERDCFDASDSRDNAICNRLLDNIQNVFDGRPEACTRALDAV